MSGVEKPSPCSLSPVHANHLMFYPPDNPTFPQSGHSDCVNLVFKTIYAPLFNLSDNKNGQMLEKHTCQVSRILRDPPEILANLQHNYRPPATLPGFSLPGCSSKKQLKMCQNFKNMRSSVAEFSHLKLSECKVIGKLFSWC